jgi:hypothetical protein
MPKKARKATKKKQSVIKGVLKDTSDVASKMKAFWK